MAVRKATKVKVPLLDLRAQYLTIKDEIDTAVAHVHEKSNYVAGAEVEAFEDEWAKYCKGEFCVALSSGTDALYLSLMAWRQLLPGDPVGYTGKYSAVLPAFTFPGVIEPVYRAGFEPALQDVDLTTACLPSQDFGQSVAMPTALYGLRNFWKGSHIIEDDAQAHGLPLKAWIACYSFYPSKNLGAYGQAGAIVTNDSDVANVVRTMRTYGEKERFVHYPPPTGNYRMDELQAGILRVKLPHLNIWNKHRRMIAFHYIHQLSSLPGLVTPIARDDTWHIFALRVQDKRGRDDLAKYLDSKGIQTAVRYPVPLHLQPHSIYKDWLGLKPIFPNAETWARENLSLPLYPELPMEWVDLVCEAIKGWVK